MLRSGSVLLPVRPHDLYRHHPVGTPRNDGGAPQDGAIMRYITVEEHFASPAFINGPGKHFLERFRAGGPRGMEIYDNMRDLGDGRVAAMDAAGIDMQVVSLNSPGVEQAEAAEAISVARDANDFLAAALKKHPKRFAGFAALAIQAPDKAADELERTVSKEGFKGANINGHTRGRYLDDKAFSPILERAQALNVPLYVHPTIPIKSVVDALYGGFAPAVTAQLSGPGWGWHIETAIHVIRMIMGGVFDRYPKLQVVIGHLGEGIPFMLPRLDKNMPRELTKLERPVADYLRNNVYYTFGGFNFPATFQNLLSEVGAGRILFSVDYPFGSMTEARTFLEQLPLSPDDRERIAHGNAEKLLGV
jgi:predicted TIM-barrel fold metal-dependent hydrolase